MNREELVNQLAQFREQGSRDFQELRKSTEVKRHMKNSVRSHPDAWFIGAVILGGLLALIFSGISIDLGPDESETVEVDRKNKKKTRRKKGNVAGAFIKSLAAAALPLIRAYAVKKVLGSITPGGKKK